MKLSLNELDTPRDMPKSTMSMNMPHDTAMPVSMVRSLLQLSVCDISCSRSSIGIDCLNYKSVGDAYDTVGLFAHTGVVGDDDYGHAFVVELTEDAHYFL